ncbi:uncharacterized protein LOC127874596 isoform X2 [Dreissena polymorpha]|uniref:uncharacterized protein LOC127874596 isoform X2 n=1 Tax=Dreissena polymorpha TaxID=45954 RepID=UPI002264B91D|nr:uncharacterized protein LOC127874596 isoform X2 [Dreissena polymorpha]
MAGEECLSKVAVFIQEGKALRSLLKGTRLDEPVLPDIFTWISHELFKDIELTPIALRHAIQTHILTGRKDITEVLIDILTGSGQNENKLEALQNQVLDPQKKQPGFLMAYMHMDASGLHMYIIQSQSSQPQRPTCKGMVELAARQLRSTPLAAITVPLSLVVDVQQNAAQIPEKCKRISFWVEEFCRETDCWHIFERKIEVQNVDGVMRFRVPRSDSTIRLKFIKHLSDASRDHVLTFCRILLRRCEFKVLEGLSDRFKSADIPFKHKYAVLSNFETELGKFNDAISIGTKPSELQERRGRVNNAVIGTSISGLVGGVLGVVGLALIPVTFGVSLGLTIAGGVIGASSGIVQGGFRVHEAVKENKSTAQIRETLEKVRGDFEKALTDFTREFNLDAIGNSGPESPGLNIRGSLSIGAILRSVHSGVGIGIAAAKVGASAATTAAAILAPVSLILDGGFMAEAIYGKATGNHTEAGRKLECLRVFQTIVNASYRGNADFNTNIVEKIMQND